MDSSRTQLGEAADGAYPLTWAEGDQVSVNGVASDALSATEAGAATATFTFDGGLATPYCLAYPAAAAGQVEFPAVQNQPLSGNIENNVTVLYGYSADATNLTLNHLTGLLKIGIKGSATLTYAQISTIDRAPIAGAFNLDFEKGTLTATESASEVITYNFIDGALNEDEAKYIYVAVPAGTYDELYVTLNDDNFGVMYATVKAGDSKPLVAGNVREFSSDIVYEATSTTDKFIIANYGDLVTFKQTVEAAEATLASTDATDEEKAAATATLSKPAVFISDVEINEAVINQVSVEWSPINAPSYTGTVSGNGYAVSGLTAPLFNTTAATIKGVHLDVAIAETVNPNVGAFARQLVANGNTPSITHCTVSGSIEVNTALKAEYFEGKDANTTISMGGLVGLATGVTFSNCVNSASLTFTDVLADGVSGTSYFGNVGGIVGAMATVDNIEPSFTNCVNKGDITYNDSSNVKAAIGGVIGNIPEEYVPSVTLDNCSNSGDIKVGGTVYHCYVGGTIGSSYTTALKLNNSTLKNTGAITISATVTYKSSYQYFDVGGIIGRQYTSSVTNGKVINRGDIKFIGKTSAHMFIGGIYGLHRIQIDSSVNYINTGDVIAATSSANNNPNKGYRISGFVAYSKDSKSLSNVQVYCNIATLLEDANGYYSHDSADDPADDPANLRLMGILYGYNEVKTLSNIKVGGSVITKATVAADGTITPVTTKVLGTDLELHEYIFGKRGLISTLPTGVELLNSAPTVE